MIFSLLSNLVKFSELFLWFFFITTMDYLHDAQEGETEKASNHEAEQKPKHFILLLYKMRFTVKRIKTTKSALLLSADQRYHDVFKGEEQTAAGQAAP